MEDGNNKYCPWCGEQIKAEAVKCRHCKRMISEPAVQRYTRLRGRRDLPGRMLAGVCAYVAQAMGLARTPVRVVFALCAVLALPAALAAYGAIWALVPFRESEPSAAERFVDWMRRTFGEKPQPAPEPVAEITEGQ